MNTQADELRKATELPPHELTMADFQILAGKVAKLEWQLSNMTGAAAAVLHAINKAGGYHVFDPVFQEPVHRAFNALAHAVGERLEQTQQRGVYGLPDVSHPTSMIG